MAQGSLPAIVMAFLSDRKGREYDDSPRPPYGKWYFYQTKQTIARQMLQAQADIKFIAQVTGLSEAEVLALWQTALPWQG